MLNTGSKLQVVHGSDGLEYRNKVRPRPSFGVGSLRSRGGLLTLGTMLFLAIGLLFIALRPQTYTASAQLLVYIKQIMTGADLAILPGRADLPLVQNQVELLRSGNVLNKVVDALQLDKDPEFLRSGSIPSVLQHAVSSDQSSPADEAAAARRAALEGVYRKLSVRQVGTSHLVTVSFKASEPQKAVRIVNKVIRIYLQELARASDIGSSKTPALRELYQSLGPSAYLISEAEPPMRADGPPAALIAVGAALLGLGVAAAVAILLDVTNDTIRNAHQLEHALGLECLGVIRRANDDIVAGHAASQHPHVSQRNALRRVTAAMLNASLQGLQTIGVTSTLPGEGATTLSIGLAQALADSGKKVLLIDGVPENPSVSRWASNSSHNPPQPRIAPCSIDGIVDVQTGLHVLPLAECSGEDPSSISAPSLDAVLGRAKGTYDFVIVDMPALAAGPDVRADAQSLDGFLLVVKWGVTASELARQALQSAGEARPRFIGAVLNMADEKTMRRYGDELPAEWKFSIAS